MCRCKKYLGAVKRLSFFLLTILFALTLTACANDRIRIKGERGAIAYYKNKYGEAVEVLSSKEWGFTTAILPTKIQRLAFTLSDGNTFSGIAKRSSMPTHARHRKYSMRCGKP